MYYPQSKIMKKCVIAEFPWQIDEIRNMPVSGINVVATNPRMAFYLEKEGINFVISKIEA